MKNRTGIIITLFIVFIGAVLLFFRQTGMGPGQMLNNSSKNTQNKVALLRETPLPIPPLLKDENPDPQKAEFQIIAQKGTTEFIKGKKAETLGYNGNYFGPVIRVRRGEEVSIKVKNNLDEQTTVHWHGLEVNGDQDGGPHDGIKPGTIWNPTFTINQPASTLWYHPHLLHKTGEQVYKGLAGLFYIDDDISDNLDIPKEYGVNDVPLVIQDKTFDSNGSFSYNLGMHDVMMGLQGDTILVNGAISPYLQVPSGQMRLRLLNGLNARSYQIHLSNNQAFVQIASDGGFLTEPVEMTNIILGPGERAEIIIDFSKFEKGDTVSLMDQETKFMRFSIGSKSNKTVNLPSKFTDIQRIDPSSAIKTRKFSFQGMGPNVNINGKQMDMDRIDEVLTLHTTEIWEVTNDTGGMMGGMPHPFHAHGTQFQILDRDGNPPPANETGWKDTFLVYPGEKVRAIATFNHTGTFMYHCHILEHEDAGMMGQFQVK